MNLYLQIKGIVLQTLTLLQHVLKIYGLKRLFFVKAQNTFEQVILDVTNSS